MPAVTGTLQKLPWFPWIGKKRPYYGWVIVSVGWLTQFTQGIVNQAFATYLTPLQAEFGWSRALLAGPRSVTQVENSILGPIEGWLLDRLGPRVMVATGSFIMGLGLILFGLTHSLWMYYVSNVIIALGTGLQGLLILSVALNHWFRRKRTMANAVMLLGFATAGIVGVPVVVFIQTTMGWRTSAIITGILAWSIGIPLSMFLRRSPEPFGLLPDGDTPVAAAADGAKDPRVQVAEEYDFTLRQAVRTPAFWLLALGPTLSQLGMAAAGIHLFLHLEQDVGLSRTTGAFVWSVASMTNIPARLLGGYFGDRVPKRFVLGISMVMIAASQFVLGIANSLALAMGYAILYGIGWGGRTPVMNAMQGEYFGRKNQGSIRGWLTVVHLPFTVAAPVVVGFLADLYGTYSPIFVTLSFVGLAGAILIFFATPPKPPETKSTSPAANRPAGH
ncbi:MAG: MFS transporter [Chloroflexi bacterium]|nr:MFS transporter [Chloroflexota bacterium]